MPRVAGIDAPIVDPQIHTAERGHGVDHEEDVGVVDQLRDAFEWLVGAGRGLGVDQADGLRRRVGGEGLGDRLVGDRFTPRHLDRVDRRAIALGDIFHAGAEDTVLDHDHLVAALDQVGDARLHAGAAGARHREGQRILRPHHLAQQVAHGVHDLEVLGVEMPEGGAGESLEHTRRYTARAGTEEHALGRIERAGTHAPPPMPRSSTSKTRVAPGGIRPPAPRWP